MSETYLISETFSTSFLYHIARFANFFFSSSSHPLKNEILTISHCSFIISRLVNFVSRRWTRGMAREFVQIFSVHCFEGPNNIVLFGFRFLSTVAGSGVWLLYLYLLSILKIQREFQDNKFVRSAHREISLTIFRMNIIM